MGNGMNKIVPGLFIGNFQDAKNKTKLQENNITHILSIHDQARKLHEEMEYLCIQASDVPGQELKQHFPQCIDFIHSARLNEGNVLVHCLAGVSRSVTVSVAYLMTATNLGWRDCLNAVRGSRRCANPNFGFQRQLQEYESENLKEARKIFKSTFTDNSLQELDEEALKSLKEKHWKWVLEGDESETTYPLAHNAYKPNTPNGEKAEKTNHDVLHWVSQGDKEKTTHPLLDQNICKPNEPGRSDEKKCQPEKETDHIDHSAGNAADVETLFKVNPGRSNTNDT